jgi:hypothetical protein
MVVLKKKKQILPGSRHLLGTIPLFCYFLVSVGEYIYIYMVHIIVKVEDTLAQQFGPLDNYMLFSVIEKVKIIYIY